MQRGETHSRTSHGGMDTLWLGSNGTHITQSAYMSEDITRKRGNTNMKKSE
jgi:hypothetical protein